MTVRGLFAFKVDSARGEIPLIHHRSETRLQPKAQKTYTTIAETTMPGRALDDGRVWSVIFCQQKESSMLRRDFVRAIVSVGLLPKALLAQQTANPAPPPPAPVPWTLGLNPKTPLPVTEAADGIAETAANFFTPTQLTTFTRLCDLLLPPLDNKPGALQAGTPMFLDFLIGISPKSRKKLYSRGLDWLDAEAKTKYKLPFAQLNPTQADALIKPWLRTWMTDHPPTEPHADFINIVHEDIRIATMNSKVWDDAGVAAGQDWVTGGLYWSPIQPDLAGLGATSTHLPPHVMSVPKATHTIPSYPR
jgi:hypothetical protein